jgi:uroporphyrinogen decarboxylase
MELVLEAKPDLLVRRAWYETVDFMSPANFRKLVLPWRKREAALAHSAGAKLGCITSSAYTPILDDLLESGMDVMLGIDPVQDARADFPLTKRKFAGKVALWGGVNGFVTIENGTPEQVKQAVYDAIGTLAPGGGFILSPVDNVREDNQRVWDNVRAFIDEWKLAC